MKLRIRGNSVRVRVTKSEVARLAQGLPVQQQTHFAENSSLHSMLVPSDGLPAPRAQFAGATISILVPASLIRAWANSDQVSIEARQNGGSATPLQILVEKDFECLHSHAEANDDAFPNPRLAGAKASQSVPPGA